MLDLPGIVKQVFSRQEQGFHAAVEVLRSKELNDQKPAVMKTIFTNLTGNHACPFTMQSMCKGKINKVVYTWCFHLSVKTLCQVLRI